MILLVVLAALAPWTQAGVDGKPQTVRFVWNNGKGCEEVTLKDCDEELTRLKRLQYEEGSCEDAMGTGLFYCESELLVKTDAACGTTTQGSLTYPKTQDYPIKTFYTNENMCPAEKGCGTWKVSTGASIAGFKRMTLSDLSVDACKSVCCSESWCNSFVYTTDPSDEDWKTCYLSVDNSMSSGVFTMKNYDYYELERGPVGVSSSEDEKDSMLGKHHHCKTYPLCFGETEETEAQALAFEATDTDQHSMPVKVLAAFGFVVTLYGAFKHFSK